MLLRQTGSIIEWEVKAELFRHLCNVSGELDIDLFTILSNSKCTAFLMLNLPTSSGEPDALLNDWNQWTTIYFFPPPLRNILLKVSNKLRNYRGSVLLIATIWETQPWCTTLLQW